MTSTATLICRVETFGPNPLCSFLNEQTGERFNAPLGPNPLLDNLSVGDEFRIQTTSTWTKLEPKPISKEKLQALREEFAGRWNF